VGPVKAATDERRGLLFGIGAYFAWGLFPLYWPLLEPANAIEILAQRMVWTLVVMMILVWRLRLWSSVRAIFANRRQLRLLAIAAVMISTNWGVYIWGVNAGRVVETSLGYFITPLATIVVGVVFLNERLRRAQWVAVAIASSAIVIIAVDYGQLPWIALTLAASFTTYGFMKKKAAAGAVESLTVETSVLALPALITLIVLGSTSHLAFGHHGAANASLLAAAGVVTAIPLLLFAGATRRLPLSKVGFIQYLTPVMQFLLGVYVDHEHMSASRWAGFALVWVALVVLIVDGLRAQRRLAEPVVGPPDGHVDGRVDGQPVDGQPVRSSTV
jgi:chloramphenicol-sensitive protein RarD